MRKSNTIKLSEALREYVRVLKIAGKLKETDIVSHWEEIMGRAVARRTNKIYIKNKTLFVFVSSSVVRNELLMMRGAITDKINERAGEQLVEKIVLR